MKVTHTAPNKGPRVKSTDTTEENQRDGVRKRPMSDKHLQ
jgi:hypothetical protein